MTGFHLARFTIDIRSPEVVPQEEGSEYKWALSDQRVLADLPAVMEQMSEEIAKVLPVGYSVEIREGNGD